MKKNIILIFLLFDLVILTGCSNFKRNISAQNLNQVCFQDNCFKVELATTPKQWMRGLMYQKSLNQNKGMLFIFQNVDKHAFWMKNTLIPLDIVWLNANQEVVYIHKNAKPCQSSNCPTINPSVKSKYVLEINGGMANKAGLSIGDKVEIRTN